MADNVKKKGKNPTIVRMRDLCIYAVRERFPNMTLAAIGNIFGNRSHSTIKESIERGKKSIRKDPQVAATIERIIKHS
jgi:chromosomal replication initiation ATPase DnaA